MFPDVKQGGGKIVVSLHFHFIKKYPKIGPKMKENGCFFLILGIKTVLLTLAAIFPSKNLNKNVKNAMSEDAMEARWEDVQDSS